ncbi:hypothetical protein [uncultured Tateyamaria sp.]|uniref:hypothetical protein n=1 Tax=uncultured Tateyamaria sp. TaxID=455651 RepID=UPI002632D0CE|nr:hypothetical protein [uncultured Tateyamaria sp.]
MVTDQTWNWTDWGDRTNTSPYVDWDDKIGGLTAFTRGANKDLLRLLLRERDNILDPKAAQADDEKAPRTRLERLEACYAAIIEQALERLNGEQFNMPPFPKDAAYTDQNDALERYFDAIKQISTIPPALTVEQPDDAFKMGPDDAVLGVIDLGIALGQRRTRRRDIAKTRFLAAWQQSAPRQYHRDSQSQPYLPFGHELLATDINQAIADYTHGTHFDEEGFNRATFSEDYRRPLGQRELGLRAAHGTHILDCAAGFDPDNDYRCPICNPASDNDCPDHNHVEQRRIIAINLPARELVGHSAQYLEFFAIFGLLRIAILSDALWELNKAKWPKKAVAAMKARGADDPPTEGFHIVVNLSFGKQASARDGTDPIAEALDEINKARHCENLRPIYLSIPAGNENLDRGNARKEIPAGVGAGLRWRVRPEDQSANFVEIWADYPKGSQIGDHAPLELEITPPKGPPLSWTGNVTPQLRYLCNGNGEAIAALYSFGIIEGDGNVDRIGYVLATRWTQMMPSAADMGNPPVLSPAGDWAIGLRNRGSGSMSLVASAQTDQTEKPESVTNQPSYFDHDDYKRFDRAGRELDSYSYPLDKSPPEGQDAVELVRRHGTVNAIAKNTWTAVSAGHRHSDGRMEGYSSTGIKGLSGSEGKIIPGLPTASMPSRDAAGFFGRLASGSRDGSAVAIQGTSVAAAMMSRRLMDLLVGETQPFVPTPKIVQLQDLAECEDKRARFPGLVVDVKSGSGRMDLPSFDEDLGRFNRGIRKRRCE